MQTPADFRTREKPLRKLFAAAILSCRRASFLELDKRSMSVRTIWCRAHPSCTFSINDIMVQGAISLLVRARNRGFDVPPVHREYSEYHAASPTLVPVLTEHIWRHGPVRVAWLSMEPHGWLVHSARVSVHGTTAGTVGPRVVLTSDPTSEQPLPLEEAIRRLRALTRSGAIPWRPFGERDLVTLPTLSDWDAARLLRRLCHPMGEEALAAMQRFLKAELICRTDLLCEIRRLVFTILESPDSRLARELDATLSRSPSNPDTRLALDALHKVAALCLGESCQEICTLVEIQREVYRSSGSAVRSLVVAATPYLAVATALELMSRS
jgi:hypothetical protein